LGGSVGEKGVRGLAAGALLKDWRQKEEK